MSRYRLTASLLNSWLRATDPEAVGNEYEDFLAALGREQRPTAPAAQAGIDFENAVSIVAEKGELTPGDCAERDVNAVYAFGQRCKDAAYQVRGEKDIEVCGLPIRLVGIADFLKAGIITDIKRVIRYEYGKYQGSAQHPMYFELFPEAVRFDYLIYDGAYCYIEQYRRGEYRPIKEFAEAFLRYLEDADLMDIYKTKWEEKEHGMDQH